MRIIFSGLILIIAFASKAQVNHLDSNSNFSIYSSKECGFQFYYPKNWIKTKFSNHCNGMFIFQDTINCSDKDKHPSVLYYLQNELVKLTGSINEHISQSISNTRNLARDSFKLIQYVRKINKNKIVYYDIRISEKMNGIYGYHYLPVFIRDSAKNLVFDIELTFPSDSCNKYNALYSYICDNFNFLDIEEKQKTGKRKRTSN